MPTEDVPSFEEVIDAHLIAWGRLRQLAERAIARSGESVSTAGLLEYAQLLKVITEGERQAAYDRYEDADLDLDELDDL